MWRLRENPRILSEAERDLNMDEGLQHLSNGHCFRYLMKRMAMFMVDQSHDKYGVQAILGGYTYGLVQCPDVKDSNNY